MFFKGFILMLVAVLLAIPLFPIGLIFAFLYYLLTGKFKELWFKMGQYFFSIAYSIDQLGNVVMSELFNNLLIKAKFRNYNMFGDPDETISSVLGKNYKYNNLTKLGIILADILDFFDPNHVIKSIENE